MNTPSLIRWLLAILFLLLGFLAAVRLLHIYLDFTLPTEITFPNSVMVNRASEFQHGGSIYRDYRKPPHVVALYGPLFFGIPGLIGRWLNSDEQGLFRIGRSMALLGTAGSMTLIWVLVRRRERVPSSFALLSVLIFFTAAIQWPVCMCFRPDAMEMFLVLLGLATFLHLENNFWRYATPAIFVAAFLFKQSAVMGPAAIVAYLLVGARRREAVRFALVAVAVYGSIFLIINYSTGGMYYLNTIQALRINVTWGNVVTVAGESALLRCLVPFALAGAVVMGRWAAGQFDLYGIFFALSFVFASVTTIRDGSADNYFLQALAIGCVIFGRELSRWLGGTDSTGNGRTKMAASVKSTVSVPAAMRPGHGLDVVVLSLSISCLFFVPAVGKELLNLPLLFEGLSRRAERDAAQLDFLRTTAGQLDALGGPILCQYDPVNLYSRNAIMMDTFIFAGLADQGLFDDRPIIDLIHARKMAAVALLFPLGTDPVPRYQSTAWFREAWLAALVEAGYRGSHVGPLYIYRP